MKPGDDERLPATEPAPAAAGRSSLARARRIGGASTADAAPPRRTSRASTRTARGGTSRERGVPQDLPPDYVEWADAVDAGTPSEARAVGEQASKAGRNLPAAIVVGAGLGALIVVSLFAHRPSFAFIVGAAVLYGCYELSHALAAAQIQITLVPLLVGSVAILAAAWERGSSGLVLAVLITLVGVVLWRIGDGAAGYPRDAAASAFILLYLPTLAAFAVLLAHPHDGAARVIALVASVVCSDTGGYATGVFFGKHPLAPIVSSAKTWEGFAGSVLACSGAGVLFLTLTFHEAWWKGLLFGLAVVVTATLGDLGESMIKRDLGIKDMGRLLPGHGGIMDRLDSLLPCAAVGYLLLSTFAPA